MNVSDFVVQRFSEWGVRRIFGYSGDGINGVIGALNRRGNDPQFIQVRHEENAALMACAHAKYTGKLGVCLATSGPGAIHLLNGLYDAKLDHQPVVAIVGHTARRALGGAFQQEVDLKSLFKDVAGEFVEMVLVPEQARHVVDRACRIALAERTVTCVILPKDVQQLPAVDPPPHAHATIHSGLGYAAPAVMPPPHQLRQAAEVLNSGRKVAILVGQGARGAAEEISEVAERLGAGVAKALLGLDVLPDLPFVTGPIGLLGTRASWELMTGCDTLLMVGTSFPYAEFLPKEGQARGVQIDIDARMISLRYPVEVPLVGDSLLTLRALLPLIEPKQDRDWRRTVEKSVADWRGALEAQAKVPAEPVNPQLVFHELSPRLPERAILAVDTGTVTAWYARHVSLREGMLGSVSGTLATVGAGLPYAIAAKLAHPDRPLIALIGDGGMQMTGVNELITLAKYRHNWSNPTFVVMVLNNRDLNMVTWEQRAMLGDPKFPASQELPDFPYARYAELLGLHGIRVDAPADVGPAWDEALAADGPVVLEAVTDPNVPLLPPRITLEEAKMMLFAIAGGDVDAKDVVVRSFQSVLAEVSRH
jgi:pyruvate dehydrogenase (quinone)